MRCLNRALFELTVYCKNGLAQFCEASQAHADIDIAVKEADVVLFVAIDTDWVCALGVVRQDL